MTACIGEDVFEEAKVIDGEQGGESVFHYRIDVLCWHVSNQNVPGAASRRFPCLAKVAELVLVLGLTVMPVKKDCLVL